MAKEKCLCEADEVLIFPCSGGSNVGQLANETAKRLTNQGVGGMYCLAGIGAHISGFAEVTREVKKVVAIDGCPVHCARKTLEHANSPVNVHVVVTELGIRKTSNLLLDKKDIAKVENAVKEELKK
ncbi:MAG TPA: putative zinc-binding protein [Candidatus Thermoplasmatota archaeon]|nr:putative zinc-binding protein [Candidatus Thermoplasmatota archaeon]